MVDSTMSLKLLIDTNGKRVVYAEAGKDFVDFLFHVLSLPVAKISSLLQEQETKSSLVNLYKSVENLKESYIQPNLNKDNLLKQVSAVNPSCSVPLLAIKEPPPPPPTIKKFYMCSPCYRTISYVTDEPGVTCPNCFKKLAYEPKYVPPAVVGQASGGGGGGEGGFVKEVVSYMVTDDLVVAPMSTTSVMELLNKFDVKKLNLLEVKMVDFGTNEAKKLLHASLHSNNVLSDVFLRGNEVAVKFEEK